MRGNPGRGRGNPGRGRGRGQGGQAILDDAHAAAAERLELVQRLSSMGLSTIEAVAAVKAAPLGSSAEAIIASCPGRPQLQSDERRLAPDGSYYTKSDFLDFFGRLDEWDAAAKQATSEPAATPAENRTELPQELSLIHI